MGQTLGLRERRDLPILAFLWKWKIATSAALYVRFFPNSAPITAYKRLRSLQRLGFLERVTDERGEASVWTLTKAGFEVVREYLPALREEGFRSENVRHDLIAQAAHLGNWLVKEPPGVVLFSEQQLRRYEPGAYPDWVPTSTKRKPDGYWRINAKDGDKLARVIALEVELSRKKEDEIRGIGYFYADEFRIDRVLWVVLSEPMAHRLAGIFDGLDVQRRGFHNFVLLSDFRALGWGAPIILGPENGKTIEIFIDPGSEKDAGKMSETCRKDFSVRVILDGRKGPFVSSTSNASERETEQQKPTPYSA
jgi:hypothetical protein